MQIQFITSGKKYKRQTLSKQVFDGYLEDNQFLIERTKRDIQRNNVSIKPGSTLITNGDQYWLITEVSFEDKRPRRLIATVKEVF